MRTVRMDYGLVTRSAPFSKDELPELERIARSGGELPGIPVVKNPHRAGYSPYAKNAVQWVAEKYKRDVLVSIMEDDEDLKVIQEKYPDYFWPGDDLRSIAGYMNNMDLGDGPC